MFIFYAVEGYKSLVIPWQVGTCLVCLYTESNTGIVYINVNMYEVHALCYCKHIHLELTEIKFASKTVINIPIIFLIGCERKSGMVGARDKIFLMRIRYTSEGQINF